ncbi:uncharacterized protein BDZ99DRAFT_649 [Mytilinidion resinicola]|uniref:Transmembrane protein n=1 Tax=Mytilinidion resinicola TaxID=574789 RepID=A0A6A6Z6M8_9PEZI|nr:uncharacterized protein BDZ99DRAFT_649 [Mytilinidion resinicola]KAF2816746.1 hypothetical protein BDZ99DRAFT_649 [Mytilinidion resinicola]
MYNNRHQLSLNLPLKSDRITIPFPYVTCCRTNMNSLFCVFCFFGFGGFFYLGQLARCLYLLFRAAFYYLTYTWVLRFLLVSSFPRLADWYITREGTWGLSTR